MQKITSGILQLVAKSLRLDTKGAETTELDDGVVSQVLNLEGLIRRGGTVQRAEGIFLLTQENTHAAADTQTGSVNPYTLFDTFLGASGGGAIDRLDIYALRTHVTKVSGAGNPTAARSTIQVPSSNAVNSGSSLNYWLEAWAALVTVGTINPMTIRGSGEVLCKVNLRVPRGSTFVFQSVSDGACVVSQHWALGLFPKALGQDATV